MFLLLVNRGWVLGVFRGCWRILAFLAGWEGNHETQISDWDELCYTPLNVVSFNGFSTIVLLFLCLIEAL